MCQGATQNYAGILAARFFLGLAEAGYYPGVLYHLSFWYPAKSTALRIAFFYASGQFSGTISGLLAYAISFMNGAGELAGWRVSQYLPEASRTALKMSSGSSSSKASQQSSAESTPTLHFPTTPKPHPFSQPKNDNSSSPASPKRNQHQAPRPGISLKSEPSSKTQRQQPSP